MVLPGPAVRRNQIFCSQLGIEPTTSMAIDTMHTLCFGPIQKLISTIVWRIVLQNCYDVRGGKEVKIDVNIKRIREELFRWYDHEGTDWGERLSDLTSSMLGGEPTLQADGSPFGGAPMRLKAYETLCFLPFAVDLLKKHPRVDHYHDLLKAGEAIIEFFAVLKREDVRVSNRGLQQLFDLMQLHLVRCDAANIDFQPKHHFALHMVRRNLFVCTRAFSRGGTLV
eukprot:8305544-Pyramimonas_sp.AAC.1